jgi:hypothetical protein
MIISVEQAKALIDLADWTDAKIEMKLKAVEQTIRAYTNNNFQARGYRVKASISNWQIIADTAIPFNVDDTVQISESQYNGGLYTITGISGEAFTVSENVKDEDAVLITKVVYPADVVDCCVNLLEWEKEHRAKVGIQSETLSRHSVTYFNMDGSNNLMGYPVSLLGCLKAYRKARF